MKKIIIIVLLLHISLVKAYSAHSYVVMDYDSGRVLMGKNYDEKMLIASTTKIMTAIIAIENSDLSSVRVVGREVLKSYGSAVYLSVDEEITLNDLLYALLLRSGNDAAVEIAYHVSGGMDEFVEMMNNKAYQLGMTNTHFVNNHGLEEDDKANYSTAYDMGILMRYAIKNDIFKRIINTREYECHTNMKKYIWKNKNKLLFSYKYMIGGKTGYTKKAHRTLVTVSEKDNKKVIVVTLNDGNDFIDHRDMANYVFNYYDRVLIFNIHDFNIEGEEGKYYIKSDVYALLKKDEIGKVKKNILFNREMESGVGFASSYLDDFYLGGVRIYEYNHLEGDNFFKKIVRWVFGW